MADMKNNKVKKKRKKSRVEEFNKKYAVTLNEDVVKNVTVKKVYSNHTYQKLNTKRIVKLVVFLIILSIFISQIIGIAKLKNEQAELIAKQDALMEQKEQLNEDLKNVNDDEYIMQQARDKLHMIMPGEKLFVIEKPVKDTRHEPEDKSDEENWWDSIKEFIVNTWNKIF